MSSHKNGVWKPMRIASSGKSATLPGKRGSYLLWLEPPLISGSSRWVHFSWVEESFCLRDFIKGQKRNQDPETNASQIWRSAKARVPCRGKLYRPIQDFEFWKQELQKRTTTNPQ
jgi:hypothetical protein